MLKELYEQSHAMAPRDSWPTYDGLELDRSEFLTSSEVSKCLRWSFFSKYPEKYPLPVGKGGNNGFAERGHAIEAAFVRKIRLLEQIGYRFEYMGDDQRSFYDAEQGISGTPDGIMYTPDGKIYLLELKSIDPRFNKKNLPKKGHIPQTVQNMHLVETCLGIKLDGGILFYIDASDIWDVREFAVSYDPQLVDLSTERADKLWAAVEPDDLEAEGVYSGDCDLCPFTHHCSQSVSLQKLMEEKADVAIPFLVENAEPTPLPIGDQETIEVFLYNRVHAAEYEKAKDSVADTVKKLVMDHGGFVKMEDGTSLIATMSPGRATIDKALLVGRGIDLDEVTKCGKPFVTLNVKEPK